MSKTISHRERGKARKKARTQAIQPRHTWNQYWPSVLLSEIKSVKGTKEYQVEQVIVATTENQYVHDWMSAVEEGKEIQARALTILQLYHMTNQEPSELQGILEHTEVEEPKDWWRRLRRLGIYNIWFDVVNELKSKNFRHSHVSKAKELHRAARAGELEPQACFFTVLPDPGKACVSTVILPPQSTRIVVGSTVSEGDGEYWPAEAKAFTHSVLMALLGPGGILLEKEAELGPLPEKEKTLKKADSSVPISERGSLFNDLHMLVRSTGTIPPQ